MQTQREDLGLAQASIQEQDQSKSVQKVSHLKPAKTASEQAADAAKPQKKNKQKYTKKR